MAGENTPARSTIVITFVGPEGKEKWMGTWQTFKKTYPNVYVEDVETLYDYKKRLKPLNDVK